MKRTLLLITVAACGPPPGECRSSDVHLAGTHSEGECSEFLSAWSHNKDVLRKHLPSTDRMLLGSTVLMRDAPWYIEGWGLSDGALWCGQSYFEIAKGPRPWCMTALFHEQLHAVECNNPKDSTHEDWGDWKQALVSKELKCGL